MVLDHQMSWWRNLGPFLHFSWDCCFWWNFYGETLDQIEWIECPLADVGPSILERAVSWADTVGGHWARPRVPPGAPARGAGGRSHRGRRSHPRPAVRPSPTSPWAWTPAARVIQNLPEYPEFLGLLSYLSDIFDSDNGMTGTGLRAGGETVVFSGRHLRPRPC